MEKKKKNIKVLFILMAALNMEKLLCFLVRKQYFLFSRVQQRPEAKSIHEVSVFLRKIMSWLRMVTLVG